jgi:hypothetical protein
MLKKLLPLVVLVCLAPYSYSDSITPYYGQTGNAAANGLMWNMDNIFPTPPGLEVNAVLYNYTIQKQLRDSVTVNVQNKNANDTGYIFRETDEWGVGSPSGTQINKVIGLPNVPREYWGDGSIDVTGNGSVLDPSVIYSYKVDPCYDPQYDPNCPGYKVPVPDIYEVDIASLYDATKDENVNLNNKVDEDIIYAEYEDKINEYELAEKEAEEKKDSKERLEKALAAADNSSMFAQALSQSLALQSMNAAINMNSYYAATINGGEYKDSVTLSDSNIPDNRKALNNMSQQKLHKQMIDMQY